MLALLFSNPGIKWARITEVRGKTFRIRLSNKSRFRGQIWADYCDHMKAERKSRKAAKRLWRAN